MDGSGRSRSTPTTLATIGGAWGAGASAWGAWASGAGAAGDSSGGAGRSSAAVEAGRSWARSIQRARALAGAAGTGGPDGCGADGCGKAGLVASAGGWGEPGEGSGAPTVVGPSLVS